MEVGSSFSHSDSLIETLTNGGWCLRDLDQLKAMAMIHSALADDPASVLNSLESELANSDMSLIGAKSLPDSAAQRKTSYLHGPKVLQARCISVLGFRESAGNHCRKHWYFCVCFCFLCFFFPDFFGQRHFEEQVTGVDWELWRWTKAFEA